MIRGLFAAYCINVPQRMHYRRLFSWIEAGSHIKVVHVTCFCYLDTKDLDYPLTEILAAIYRVSFDAQFWRRATWTVNMNRIITPRQPAPDMQTHKIAHMVNVQMTGKDFIEFGKVRSQSKQITH